MATTTTATTTTKRECFVNLKNHDGTPQVMQLVMCLQAWVLLRKRVGESTNFVSNEFEIELEELFDVLDARGPRKGQQQSFELWNITRCL